MLTLSNNGNIEQYDSNKLLTIFRGIVNKENIRKEKELRRIREEEQKIKDDEQKQR